MSDDNFSTMTHVLGAAAAGRGYAKLRQLDAERQADRAAEAAFREAMLRKLDRPGGVGAPEITRPPSPTAPGQEVSSGAIILLLAAIVILFIILIIKGS